MNTFEALALMHVDDARRSWDRPSPADWADVLATFPLFTGVSKRRLRRLARGATLAELAPGETIVSDGDPGDFLYVILGGRAKALSSATSRALGTGDYFGELALIDRQPRSATIVATTELHVMRLPSHSVLKLARRHPTLIFALLKNLTTQLRQLESRAARAA